MEKITKEELKNLLGGTQLSDDELEKVSGGISYAEVQACVENCKRMYSGYDRALTYCYSSCY